MKNTIDDNSLVLIDDFDFGIAILDTDLNILGLNKKAKKMFPGIEKNKELDCYRLFHRPPHEDYCPRCPIKKAITKGKISEIIESFSVKGEKTFFKLKGIPIKDNNGKVIKIIKIFEDISEIKIAESRLNNEILRNTISAELSTALIEMRDIDEISQLVLENAKKITNSAYGYVGYIDPSLDNLTRSTLSDETDTESLLNDLKKNALKSDYLSIPVSINHKLMGQIVLADPKKSYTDEDIEIIKRFADIYAIAVNRKISEDSIKLSEAYKHAILNAIPDMLFRIKKDGTYIDYFPGSTINPDIPKENFIGKKVIDILPEYISKNIMELIKKAIESNRLQSWEYWLPIPYPEGELHFFEGRIVKYNEDEAIGIIRDISDRKKAEISLKESENRYKALAEELQKTTVSVRYFENVINSMTEALFVTNLNGIIENTNNAASKLLDYPKESIIGNKFCKYFENEKEADNICTELFKNKNIYNKELLFRKNNNTKVDVLFSGSSMYDENNQIIRTVCIAKDITELKRAQEEAELNRQKLLQAEKLTSLGELSAGIAHEITQPLTGITMGINNIIYDLSEENIDINYLKGRCYDLLSYTDRINKIIQHIRIFSREQKFTFFEYFNINDSINDALSLINNQYKNHNIKINLNLSNNLNKIKGNTFKLEQVILNLLSNAKYAVNKKSEILKTKAYVKEISIKTYLSEKKIFLEIRDNGIGINKEDLKKVFDPFFTTKSADDGTGLGMSIVYSIIKEMGGEITIKSEKENFTIIYISFLT